MARRSSLLRGALLLSAANLALRGSSMCFQVFLSNRLGAAGMGLVQLISNVGFLAAAVGSAGVRTASMYLTAEEYGSHRPGGMRRARSCCLLYGLCVSLAAGALLYGLSGAAASRWIGDGRAASSLRIFALFLPCSCLWSVMAGYFTARSRLRSLVLVELADQVVAIGVTVVLLLAWAGASTERACCSIMLGNGVSTALSLLALLALDASAPREAAPPGLRMGRRLLRVCLPVGASDTLRAGLTTAEHLLIPRGLARFGESPDRAMADYGTIHGMVFPVLMFPSVLIYSLADLLVPELAKCRAAGRSPRIRGLTDRCLRMGLLFSAASAGLCAVLGGPLGRLLYHSGEAGRYLRRFAPLILILYMDAMVDGMHRGLGQQVYCARVNLLTSLLDVALLPALLPRYGVAGYFFCFTATHILNFLLSIARLLRVTGCRPGLARTLLTLLCAAAASASSLAVPETAGPLACCLGRTAVFAAILAASLRAAGVLRRRDLVWLRAALAAGGGD